MYKQRESALICSRLMQVFGADAEHPVTVEAIRKRAASLFIMSSSPLQEVLHLSRTSDRRAPPRSHPQRGPGDEWIKDRMAARSIPLFTATWTAVTANA